MIFFGSLMYCQELQNSPQISQMVASLISHKSESFVHEYDLFRCLQTLCLAVVEIEDI